MISFPRYPLLVRTGHLSTRAKVKVREPETESRGIKFPDHVFFVLQTKDVRGFDVTPSHFDSAKQIVSEMLQEGYFRYAHSYVVAGSLSLCT